MYQPGYIPPPQLYYQPQQPHLPPQPKGSGLGVAAFIMALVAAVISCLGVWICSDDLGSWLAYSSMYYSSTDENVLPEPVISWTIWTIVLGVLSLVGLASLIMGIVAIATNRGRVAGIFALIISLLAPSVMAVIVVLVFNNYAAL